MANSFDASGVKEEGGIDWQGEGLQSERPTHEAFASASATFESTLIPLPFQGFDFGPSGEEVGRL